MLRRKEKQLEELTSKRERRQLSVERARHETMTTVRGPVNAEHRYASVKPTA
jgi:hypothetical protein